MERYLARRHRVGRNRDLKTRLCHVNTSRGGAPHLHLRLILLALILLRLLALVLLRLVLLRLVRSLAVRAVGEDRFPSAVLPWAGSANAIRASPGGDTWPERTCVLPPKAITTYLSPLAVYTAGAPLAPPIACWPSLLPSALQLC